MKKSRKIIALLMAVCFLLSSFTLAASAATVKSSYKMICTGTGYNSYNNTNMYGQTMIEKAVTVSKNKVLQINPYTASNTNNSHKLKKYVRFTIWVYDINTGKRIKNVVCDNNGAITWKNTTGKTAYLSVQVRPYIAQSAWNNYSYNSINAYIKSTQYQFKCNNNY